MIGNKLFVEKNIQDDEENIIKIIVKEGGAIKGKDTIVVNYYNIKYGQEIRMHAEPTVILATFELISRAMSELEEAKNKRL